LRERENASNKGVSLLLGEDEEKNWSSMSSSQIGCEERITELFFGHTKRFLHFVRAFRGMEMAFSSLPEVQSLGGRRSKSSSSLQQQNNNVCGGNSSSITSGGTLPRVVLPAAFGAPSSLFHHGLRQFLQSGAFLAKAQWIEHKVASRDHHHHHHHNGGCKLVSSFGSPFCI